MGAALGGQTHPDEGFWGRVGGRFFLCVCVCVTHNLKEVLPLPVVQESFSRFPLLT